MTRVPADEQRLREIEQRLDTVPMGSPSSPVVELAQELLALLRVREQEAAETREERDEWIGATQSFRAEKAERERDAAVREAAELREALVADPAAEPEPCAACSPPQGHLPGPPDPPGPPRGICPHCSRRLTDSEVVCSVCHPHGVVADPAAEGTQEHVCPDCRIERADYEGPNGAWLPTCPNCGSASDPVAALLRVRGLTTLDRTESLFDGRASLEEKLEEMKWALVDALKWGETPCAECGHVDWQEREVPSTYNTHELEGLPDWLNAVDLHKERIRQLQDALCECPQREFFKASLHDETCPVYVATTSVEEPT